MENKNCIIPVHEQPKESRSFERLDMLWERYPQYHEKICFATLDQLLEEHESYQKDFEGLEEEYREKELEFFRNLTEIIMPFFQWWYQDLTLYEEKDGFSCNWRLERTRIRTKLTADGIINPKWKHELSLFHAIRKKYPDTLYQYRPDWLGRQSLDLL